HDHDPAPQKPTTADAGDPRASTPANQPAERPQTYAQRMLAKLQQPVSFDKAIERETLRDVLGFLSDKYEITFIVNVKEFERATGNPNIEDAHVRLPRMPGVTLQTVLRYLLGQLPGDGTVLVRRDHLEVGT